MIISDPLTLDWTDFELGDPTIDSQHKKIIDGINDLYFARFNQNFDDIKVILQRIIYDSKHHFSEEEDLLIKINYPDREKHIQEHMFFIDQAQQFQTLLDEGKDCSKLLQNFLFEWLLGHMRFSDKKVLEYQNQLSF